MDIKRWWPRAAFLILFLFLAGCGEEGRPRATIVLFTDYHVRDVYLAQLKGAIKTTSPNTDIIDAASNLSSDTLANSYLLDQTARYFPAGTIFLVIFGERTPAKQRPIILLTQAGKTYVGVDNGIFTRVVAREGLYEAREIQNPDFFFQPDYVQPVFPNHGAYSSLAGRITGGTSMSIMGPTLLSMGRDILGPAAAQIARGQAFSKFGRVLKSPNMYMIEAPTLLSKQLTAQIIHIDTFGHVVTNISREYIEGFQPEQLIRISYYGRTMILPFITDLSQAPTGRLFCYLNANEELEISILGQNAAQLINAKVGNSIILTY